MEGHKVLCSMVYAVLVATYAAGACAAADNPEWYPGPNFQVANNADAVNIFQGQVPPTGLNQLTNTITMDETGPSTDAQNLQVKDIIFAYGPVNASDPVTVNKAGPPVAKYLSNPVLEGGKAVGLNIQMKARPGYHFVSISFAVGLSQTGPSSDAFFIDGLGSSTVGSGSVSTANPASTRITEGLFVATNIYTPQITVVPNNAVPSNGTRFAIDNVHYVLERD